MIEIEIAKEIILEEINNRKNILLEEREISINDIEENDLYFLNKYFEINSEKFDNAYLETKKEFNFMGNIVDDSNYEIILILLETKNLVSNGFLEEIEIDIENNNKIHLEKLNNLAFSYRKNKLIELYFQEWYEIEKIFQTKEKKLKKTKSRKKTKIKETKREEILKFFKEELQKKNLTQKDLKFIKNLQKIFDQNIVIKKLANFLGRSKKTKNVKNEKFYEQNQKLSNRPTNITGIVYGNDLENILKYQLIYKKRKNLKKIFNLNFIEKKLLQLEQKNYEKVQLNNKGNIIICLDTSGSMQGEKEEITKALSFEIVRVALKTKRKVFIINFSIDYSEILIESWQKDFYSLYKFMNKSFNGGTDFDTPLAISLEKLKEKDFQNSDVIIISDFYVSDLNDNLKELIKASKEKDNRFFGVNINGNKFIESYKNTLNYIFEYSLENKKESLELIEKEISTLE